MSLKQTQCLTFTSKSLWWRILDSNMVGSNEHYLGLCGTGSCQQGFSSAGRSIHQNTFWGLDAQILKLFLVVHRQDNRLYQLNKHTNACYWEQTSKYPTNNQQNYKPQEGATVPPGSACQGLQCHCTALWASHPPPWPLLSSRIQLAESPKSDTSPY